MPLNEFNEWMIYEKVEPFGDRRGDIQTAMLMALLANINRNPNSLHRYSVEDFLPNWEPKQVAFREQSPEEQLMMIRFLQARQNGIVNG